MSIRWTKAKIKKDNEIFLPITCSKPMGCVISTRVLIDIILARCQTDFGFCFICRLIGNSVLPTISLEKFWGNSWLISGYYKGSSYQAGRLLMMAQKLPQFYGMVNELCLSVKCHMMITQNLETAFHRWYIIQILVSLQK